MSEHQPILDRLHALIDEYHELDQPAELGDLWRIRREIAWNRAQLSKFVKKGYGKKVLSYAIRKFQTAKEILAAMEQDKVAVGVKARSMVTLTVHAEALNSVMEKKEAEVSAESEWEEIVDTSKSVKEVLFAMSQEIQDGMAERGYQAYLDGLQAKAISEDELRHAHYQQQNG